MRARFASHQATATATATPAAAAQARATGAIRVNGNIEKYALRARARARCNGSRRILARAAELHTHFSHQLGRDAAALYNN